MWKCPETVSITQCPSAISKIPYEMAICARMQAERASGEMHKRILPEQKICCHFIVEKGFAKASTCCNGLFQGKDFMSCQADIPY